MPELGLKNQICRQQERLNYIFDNKKEIPPSFFLAYSLLLSIPVLISSTYRPHHCFLCPYLFFILYFWHTFADSLINCTLLIFLFCFFIIFLDSVAYIKQSLLTLLRLDVVTWCTTIGGLNRTSPILNRVKGFSFSGF